MDAKSYSLLHTQLCDVISIGHIAPWLRAQPEHTQHRNARIDVDGLAAAGRARAGGLAGLRVHVQV